MTLTDIRLKGSQYQMFNDGLVLLAAVVTALSDETKPLWYRIDPIMAADFVGGITGSRLANLTGLQNVQSTEPGWFQKMGLVIQPIRTIAWNLVMRAYQTLRKAVQAAA